MRVDIRKIYTVLLLIMPIINSYNFWSLQNFYIFTIIAIIISLICLRDEKSIEVSGSLLLYLCYMVFSCVIPVIFLNLGVSSVITRLLRFGSYFLVFFLMGYKLIDQELLYKTYKAFCITFSVLILIQYLASLAGHPFTLLIPNTIINGELNSSEYITSQLRENRFSTFFLEPAHQAQYMLPCLGITLFMTNEDGKADLKGALLISIGMATTTSMLGILGAGIIWLVYYGDILRSKNPRRLLQLIVLVVLAVIVISIGLQQPIIQEQIRKKTSSFNGLRIIRGTSSYARLALGWECFGSLDFFHKLFGVGFRYTEAYLEQSGLGAQLYSGTLVSVGYMNGMSKMLFDIGIIGTILFFAMLGSFIRNKFDKTIGILLVSFFIIMFTSDCYPQPSMYLPILLIINHAYMNGYTEMSKVPNSATRGYQYGRN